MSLQRCAGAAALALAVAACAGDAAPEEQSRDGLPARAAGQLLISAAASLADVFAEMEQAFENRHPEVDVLLNLGSSSSLRSQILDGAPADVFASANAANMDRIVEAGAVSGLPRVFARNTLQIAVPAGNPAGVAGLEDFADEGLRLGLCAREVPCGELAWQALDGAGITPSLDTGEPNVRALLTKVALGELDAGITYATDVAAAAGAVDGIEIPRALNRSSDYSAAVLAGAPNPDAARAFIEFILSPAGRATLANHGFILP
ncbi:MAG TPA: molybdate ABC transporter substrate-binding protein [Longimicrobiales bacterium]|nr:molybdate ABC transporter substrate-binding protein [Longimicrobiales bacterium]